MQLDTSNVAERLGLPFAWPLMEKDAYTSVGVNFGDINIEFINFRVRFGIEGTAFRGFSGIAFKASDSLREYCMSMITRTAQLNLSVEQTNCSKPQLAPHLERSA